MTSALARTEIARALLSLGSETIRRGKIVLGRMDLIRVGDQVLIDAGALLPVTLRSLDAIHLATARLIGSDLGRVVTYDDRLGEAAEAIG